MSWQTEQNERLLESQTDGLASSLSDKVNRIKQITINMQDSMNQEQAVLDDVGSSFNSISTDISRTTKKLMLVINTPHGKRMLMIVGFVVLFFCFVAIARG
ncbi:hypothetical protein HDV03_002198 [Kappamyces sp. JEL0829]|nr:hypothetical protein HDV03_002198 [Kappamyces sp. JEL0829]